MKILTIIFLLIMQTNQPHNSFVDCTKIKYTDEELAYIDSPSKLFTGQCKCLFESGQPALENNYVNGRLNGPSYIWYKNGQVQLESQYKEGRRIGILTTHFENGDIESSIEYGDNEQIKSLKQWDKSGKLIMTYPN